MNQNSEENNVNLEHFLYLFNTFSGPYQESDKWGNKCYFGTFFGGNGLMISTKLPLLDKAEKVF